MNTSIAQIDVQQATQYGQLIDPRGTSQFGWAIMPLEASWQEKQTAPLADIIDAVKTVDLSANSVFICPAPRNPESTSRKDMDAAPCPVVWVDYDAQKTYKPFPKTLVKALKPYLTTIQSGSLNNFHGYIKLAKRVNCRNLRILNFAFAEALGGDNKWSDNALLRLPGTFNPKPHAQRPVKITQQSTDTISASDLFELLLDHTEEHVTREFCVWATREKNSGRTLTNVDADISSLLARVHPRLAALISRNESPSGGYGDESQQLYNFQRDLYKNSDLDEDEAYTLIQTYDPFMDRLGHRADKEISKVWYEGENDPKRLEAREKFMGKAQSKVAAPVGGELFMMPGGPDEVKASIITEHLAAHVPDVFLYEGQLCVVRPEDDRVKMNVLTGSKLIMQLNKYFPMYTKVKNDDGELETVRMGVKRDVAGLVINNLEWPEDLPHLRGLSSLPCIIRRDGKVSANRGYDTDTQYYYTSTQNIDLPTNPSKEDVRLAKDLIFDKVLYDVPWRDPDGDLANFVAMMMTPVLRQYLGNLPTPAAAIDANHAGSGKTMLSTLLANPSDAGQLSWLMRGEELQKEITAALTSDATVIQIDNIEGVVRSPVFARLFTSSHWKARRLGRNDEQLDLENNKLWVFTGNNLKFGGDLGRRVIVSRLKTEANPERRDGFKIPNLTEWLLKPKNQIKLYRALVILALDWIAADAPTIHTTNGDYTRWTSAMAGLLDYHGLKGFFSNRDEVMADDEEKDEWTGFFEYWYERQGSEPVSVPELLQLRDSEMDLMWTGNFLEEIVKAPSPGRKLGIALSDRRDQVFGNYQLVFSHVGHARAKYYKVIKIKKGK